MPQRHGRSVSRVPQGVVFRVWRHMIASEALARPGASKEEKRDSRQMNTPFDMASKRPLAVLFALEFHM